MKLSRKQKQVFSWWCEKSPVKNMNGIIADGSIRAGKTFSFRQSFIIWAMNTFNGQKLGICGKTIGSIRRNVTDDLIKELEQLRYIGYETEDKQGRKCIVVKSCSAINYFYLFAGNDERSQNLIQGITLAGVYLDEVALMPESFVNQATGRCSVEGSKWWFNCNPDSPNHYFKKLWIDKADEKKLIYLHFDMDDNPSLSEEIKDRYKSQYAGVFYQRYILGQWALAEGLIYPQFDEDNMYDNTTRPVGLEYNTMRTIACDYGTHNPCTYLDIYDDGEVLWVDRQYYYDGRAEKKEKTDAQYADDMAEFMGENICDIVVDPSATSFITELRHRGWIVKEANNDVLNGIRTTNNLVAKKKIKVNKDNCKPLILEMQSYVWDDKASLIGKEQPIKANDHSPDALRYDVNTKLPKYRIGL